MRESFVFHAEYIEDLPAEYQSVYAMYAIRYGIYEEEPTLDGLEQTLWLKIKRRIDYDTKEWEHTKKARVESGRKGGIKSAKAKSSTLEDTQAPLSTLEDTQAPLSTLEDTQAKQAVSVSVSVSESVNEFESENVSVNPENLALSPSLPSQSYVDAVFEIFQEAGLPCCNKNKLTFWQRDFKNALEYIHSAPDLRGLHSDAIIGACCNYVRTIKDPQSYLKNKYSFDRLVKIKNFTDFLPDNYVPNNFKRWDTKDEAHKEKPIAPAADPFAFVPDTPTVCLCGGKLTRENHGAGLLYVKCKTCGRWAEHDPLKDGWEWSDAAG